MYLSGGKTHLAAQQRGRRSRLRVIGQTRLLTCSRAAKTSNRPSKSPRFVLSRVTWSQPGSNRRPPDCKFGWDDGGWCRLGLVGLLEQLCLLNSACWWRVAFTVCLIPASPLLRRKTLATTSQIDLFDAAKSWAETPCDILGCLSRAEADCPAANSGSDAFARSPLISRKVSIATRARRLLPSMNG